MIKKKVFKIISLVVSLKFFALTSFCKTVITFYKDAVYVTTDIKTNIVLIPYTSYEISTKDNKILEIIETNVLQPPLIAELNNINKEIEDITKKIKLLSSEVEKLKTSSELIRSILISPYQKDIKTINSMIENFESIQEKIFNLTNNTIPELEKEKSKKIERKKEIENLQEKMKMIKLLNNVGKLYYKIPGKWENTYSLDLNQEVLSLSVKFSLPKEVKIKSDKIVITSAEMVPEILDISLKRLIGNVYKPIYKKGIIKTYSKLEEGPEEIELDQPKPLLEEKTSDIGILWEINKELILENEVEIKIFDKIPTKIEKKYYAIPSKYTSGILTLGISNTSDISLIPGNLEVLYYDNKIDNITIEKTIPKNGYFETRGIPVKEINIKRELVEERIENPKFLGTNKRISKTYKTSIINNLPSNIKLSILDRIPIPYEDKIKVEINKVEPKPVENNDKIKKEGLFSIETTIEKGKEINYILSYSVEYPADMYYYEYER